MIDFLIAITREAGERVLYESRRIKGKKKEEVIGSPKLTLHLKNI